MFGHMEASPNANHSVILSNLVLARVGVKKLIISLSHEARCWSQAATLGQRL